jgi:hypothetical protein
MPIVVQTKFKSGWAVVGGKKCYFRSDFERKWAEYLEFLKKCGEVIYWEYEPKKFEFEGIRSGTVFYLPDFYVIYKDDGPIWHETKGHLEQKNVTQFRRMAKYYPDERIVLVMQNIPKRPTKKNFKKRRRLKNAKKYVERVIDGTQILKQVS